MDNDNVTHSIFSGVERDSLTWRELELIASGATIEKQSKAKFFKYLVNLNINIKNNLIKTIVFKTKNLYLWISI
jgi:hypothetical protein